MDARVVQALNLARVAGGLRQLSVELTAARAEVDALRAVLLRLQVTLAARRAP